MNPAAVLALADQAGVSLSISAAGTLKAKGGKEPVARLAPLIKEHKDALLAHLKAMERKQGNGCSAYPRRKTCGSLPCGNGACKTWAR